ncbi:helix-turn-helix transcriptional regulator [Enterobacillus tribolii]|uniref:Regulatory LuxR family protein n=1 Tax=Enterobacillus tribolii TaxID=1487935 RepID=A0A370Q3U6_9GAMM|nr:LuxR C-terminal-related transcriptional regulator [Enterobacillus tribolii]MBW7981715.1 hypothetical protein [Enterobacillus tribolii]RDK83017.1 regulatory LuxR family protein [Enterobacillus tribolii]
MIKKIYVTTEDEYLLDGIHAVLKQGGFDVSVEVIRLPLSELKNELEMKNALATLRLDELNAYSRERLFVVDKNIRELLCSFAIAKNVLMVQDNLSCQDFMDVLAQGEESHVLARQAEGHYFLTPGEKKVCHYLALQLRQGAIATMMGVSTQTVSQYKKNAMRKLQCDTNVEFINKIQVLYYF